MSPRRRPRSRRWPPCSSICRISSDSGSRSPIANSIYNLYSHSVYFVSFLYSAAQRGVKPRLILTTFAPALVIAAVSLTLFPVPVGVAVEGLILGVLGAMVAVGMALIYRANRILNFAQGGLGTAPTGLVVSLGVYAGRNYLVALSGGLVGSVLLGALVELALIRRVF